MNCKSMIATATTLWMLAASGAGAAEYRFSYELSDPSSMVTGSLIGTLESDSNTFDITSLKNVQVNGQPIDDQLTVVSTDADQKGLASQPRATLDASFLDFELRNSAGSQKLLFGVKDASTTIFGIDVAGGTSEFGGTGRFVGFVPAAFKASLSASAVSAAPEPSCWALMTMGVGLVGAALSVARRRRRSPRSAVATA